MTKQIVTQQESSADDALLFLITKKRTQGPCWQSTPHLHKSEAHLRTQPGSLNLHWPIAPWFVPIWTTQWWIKQHQETISNHFKMQNLGCLTCPKVMNWSTPTTAAANHLLGRYPFTLTTRIHIMPWHLPLKTNKHARENSPTSFPLTETTAGDQSHIQKNSTQYHAQPALP